MEEVPTAFLFLSIQPIRLKHLRLLSKHLFNLVNMISEKTIEKFREMETPFYFMILMF